MRSSDESGDGQDDTDRSEQSLEDVNGLAEEVGGDVKSPNESKQEDNDGTDANVGRGGSDLLSRSGNESKDQMSKDVLSMSKDALSEKPLNPDESQMEEVRSKKSNK